MKPFNFKLFILFSLLTIELNQGYSQTPDIFSPVFSHLSGRYNSDIQVQLTSRTTDATIHFTLDGTEPDSTSQVYSGPIPITGDNTYITLRAIAINDSGKSFIGS